MATMASVHDTEILWHPGEQAVHHLLRVPERENPTSPFLTPRASYVMTVSPLLALGTLDQNNNPWTTVWGGEPGFSRPIGQSIVDIRTVIDRVYDPVAEVLYGVGREDGEVVGEEDGKGKMVGGLGVFLEKRIRVKLFGRVLAGAVGGMGEAHLVVRIEQSLGMYRRSKIITCGRSEP
jgi:hypothetical protein